jgi:hypothetical protein
MSSFYFVLSFFLNEVFIFFSDVEKFRVLYIYILTIYDTIHFNYKTMETFIKKKFIYNTNILK